MENLEVDSEDLKLKSSFTMQLVGSTGAGKTYFLYNLLCNLDKMMTIVPEKVVYLYSVHQPLYDKMSESLGDRIKFIKDFPENLQSEFEGLSSSLLCVDDLMIELQNNKDFANFFVKHSHHLHVSVIFLAQQYFFKSPLLRTVSINTHYIISFKCPREQSQLAHLARQISPTGWRKILKAFQDSTKNTRHSYILLDLHPVQKDYLRVRSQILPGQEQVVYNCE